MDARIARLETEIIVLRSRVACTDAKLRALRHEMQAANTELSGLRLRFPPRNHEKLVTPLAAVAVLITIVLYVGLFRGFGWI